MIGIGILLIFLVFAALMVSGRLPALLALPLMALAIAVVARIPGGEIVKTVIEGGVTRLSGAYISVIFGAMLGQIMMTTGITEKIIKKAAELGGENTLLVSIVMSAATALLFSTLSGLGAVIMVGSITLPILASAGVPAIVAAGSFMLSIGVGMAINLTNWAYWTTLTKIQLDDIKSFSLIVVGLTAVTTLLYLLIELRKAKGARRTAWAMPAAKEESKKDAPWYSLITPLVPLVLVLGFKLPIVTAFLCGILFALLTTSRSLAQFTNMATRSAYNGISDAAPAVMLMVVIGMVLNTVLHPTVATALGESLKGVLPTSPFGYILFFALLAPLALYRGPLNMWGLGSGIVSLLAGLGILSPLAVTAGFLATERMQVIGDPTNTHNVWAANFTKVEVSKLTMKLVPYLWVLTAAVAVVAAFMFV